MATYEQIHPGYSAIGRGGAACDVRLATVNRIARLMAGNGAGLARIHRISNRGVELSSTLDLPIGKGVRLDLSETISAEATVTSRDNKRYDLAFGHDISCAMLLRQLVAEARSSRARPLRLNTSSLTAAGASPEGAQQLRIENISQRGMKVRHDGTFHEGLPIRIQLPNGRECRGLVRWTRLDDAGVQLIDILSVDELGDLNRLSEPSCRQN